MTPAELLRDMQAAHAARSMYHRAAERHAERALEEQDAGQRNRARYLARLALLCQHAAATEYDAQSRLAR